VLVTVERGPNVEAASIDRSLWSHERSEDQLNSKFGRASEKHHGILWIYEYESDPKFLPVAFENFNEY
jgi:hypothetical protein